MAPSVESAAGGVGVGLQIFNNKNCRKHLRANVTRGIMEPNKETAISGKENRRWMTQKGSIAASVGKNYGELSTMWVMTITSVRIAVITTTAAAKIAMNWCRT